LHRVLQDLLSYIQKFEAFCSPFESVSISNGGCRTTQIPVLSHWPPLITLANGIQLKSANIKCCNIVAPLLFFSSIFAVFERFAYLFIFAIFTFWDLLKVKSLTQFERSFWKWQLFWKCIRICHCENPVITTIYTSLKYLNKGNFIDNGNILTFF
jgi:hypothetical protein